MYSVHVCLSSTPAASMEVSCRLIVTPSSALIFLDGNNGNANLILHYGRPVIAKLYSNWYDRFPPTLTNNNRPVGRFIPGMSEDAFFKQLNISFLGLPL